MAAAPTNVPHDYEVKLRAVADEARKDGDARNLELILSMVDSLRQGRYERLKSTYSVLRPLYKNRVGKPPTSRGERGTR